MRGAKVCVADAVIDGVGGIGTAVPALGEGAGNAVDAFGTALVWAETSAVIACADVAVTKTIAAVQSSPKSVPRMRHCVSILEREMLLS